MAIHFTSALCPANSCAQIGQTLLFASISIAQLGHSFFFICGAYVFSHLMNLPHKVLGTGAEGVNSSTSSFTNFIDLVGATTFTLLR